MINKILKIVLLVAVLGLGIAIGGWIGQATFEPQIITQTEIQYVPQIIEKIVEKPVPSYVPQVQSHFSSLEELNRWLGTVDIWASSCGGYALGLQQRAWGRGYILSVEVIFSSEYNQLFKQKLSLPEDEAHFINLAVIGREVYYIEPQTKEVVLRGYLD